MPISPSQPVQMFWHGPPLSRFERLSIQSFLRNGHPVELHVYDAPSLVPAGTKLCDANEIIPRKRLFRHKRTGSLGVFADWFRYKLLRERGGLWVDTDIVCLRPFDYDQPEIFAWEDGRLINNAVLGLPAGHPLAQWLVDCCENPNTIRPYDDRKAIVRKLRRKYLQFNRQSHVRWGESGPKALTAAAAMFGLTDRALSREHFFPVHCDHWRSLFESAPSGLPWTAASRAVHLWNNMTERQDSFDKEARTATDSPFEQLCARYGVD